MKVYSLPDDLPAPTVDYHNFDMAKMQADEDAHMARLKQWLLDQGFTGSYTGEIYSTPMADGFAMYMFADKGRESFLIHLPYGDGYQGRDVEYVPMAEIKKRIDMRRKANVPRVPPIQKGVDK